MLTNEHSRFRKSKIKTVNNTDRPNCRCGNATPKPGKLTCCGQRCACYMQSKACSGCRCRGCRNPHMIDGVKVYNSSTSCLSVTSKSFFIFDFSQTRESHILFFFI